MTFQLEEFGSVGILKVLRIVAKHGPLNINLLTRKADMNHSGEDKSVKKLCEMGLLARALYYNESVHAKMFIIDNQVLSTSSMNLYSESTAVKSWESRIVSIDSSNINLARESFQKVLNDRETKPQN